MTTLTDVRPDTSVSTALRMTDEPGVRFGITNAVLAMAFFAGAAAGLDPTELAWVAVLAAGLVGAALSAFMTATLGVVAWAWFTGFVENRFGELTFADADLERLVVFVVATLALAVFTRRTHQLIKENAHA